MPNKSLDVFLFVLSVGLYSTRRVKLDWKRRINIINEITWVRNFLPNYEMNPKKSDFGMARIFGEKQSEANTTDGVVGHSNRISQLIANSIWFELMTILSCDKIQESELVCIRSYVVVPFSNSGYMAPEYDVFRFGKRIVDFIHPNMV
ncbi:hypothetical protein CUMW_010270, partial [Citrus unshiu]